MKKWLPIIIIIACMIAAYFYGVQDYFTIEMLKKHHQSLQDFVAMRPITSPLLYMLIYTTMTALSLPGGTLLSLIGGFLFPLPWSTIYVVIGATCGASALFLAAKTALADLLRKKAGPRIEKMRQGFEDNAWSYMLFLRFIPIFPFWLVNLAPAFFNVSFITYLWTTIIGIIPGAYAYTQAGSGIGAILESDKPLSLSAIFNTQIQIALIVIGILALLPIVIKKYLSHKQNRRK